MHELSLAHGILDVVQSHVPPARVADVRAIRVRVGDMAGIAPESLDLCFRALVAGTPLAASRLAIERVPVRCTCGRCGHVFETSGMVLACPACDSPSVTLASGMDLQVVDLELEEAVAV